MSQKLPVAALMTDFGLGDHYVGVVKGVMLSLCPSLRVIDITHEIEAQNVREAAFLLWASYRFLPAGTVIVCVVDPGVGSSRDIIIARTKRHILLAPRNGVLDLVLWQEKVKVVTVFQKDLPKSKSILPKAISSTFHGRDIFAPLAAHLAVGARIDGFGERTRTHRIDPPFVDAANSDVTPRILHIDRFGNIVTNIAGDDENFLRTIAGVQLRSRKLNRWVSNFDSAPDKEPCLLVGSSGLVEIVARNDSAARILGVTQPSTVKILQR